MSSEALAWAWRQVSVTGNEKVCLLALADEAQADGTLITEEGQAYWASKIGVAETTVRANFKRLEERGYLERQSRYSSAGGRTADALRLLTPPGEHGGNPPGEHGGTPRRDAAASAGARKTESSSSTSNGGGPRGDHPLMAFSLEEDPDEDVARDGEEFLRRKQKVGSHIVTPGEMHRAVLAMSEFNRQAGTAQGLGPNLTPIVGRIREHPRWDAAKHVRLVQSAFRLRWWEKQGRRRPGPPTPKVIYGSTDCFVNVANDAADEALGRTEKIEERRDKYDRSVVRDD